MVLSEVTHILPPRDLYLMGPARSSLGPAVVVHKRVFRFSLAVEGCGRSTPRTGGFTGYLMRGGRVRPDTAAP